MTRLSSRLERLEQAFVKPEWRAARILCDGCSVDEAIASFLHEGGTTQADFDLLIVRQIVGPSA